MNLPENTSAAPADWPPMRVGEGWDTHALVPGRPLILGGVHVPHTHGLAGHSDADALLHAITDAVLGAAGLGDIGTHFPDTDAAFAGADSHALLQEAARRVRATGWRIASALGVAPEQVNVKAKTAEKLGPVGRGESMEARAVALLVRP